MSEARDSHFIADNRRQVERLSKLGWYHSIELPDGSVIPGHQSIEQLRNRLKQFPVPEDLTGKRVLDIGAWDGWFSFEMERRGASVLAVDSTKNTRLLEAKSLLGSHIDYRIADICRLTAKDVGTFDIVLFLGVLYHLKHPLLALENVCGMCDDMACIESFVTDGDPDAIPAMEFYETAELRGQLDNWCGPNLPCLLALTRTAGFARARCESVLAERAHVSAYRRWNEPEGNSPVPQVLCVENSVAHDHSFSATADDYITFYFTIDSSDPILHPNPHPQLVGPASAADAQLRLSPESVYPEIGPYATRPIYVAKTGDGWQASCKIPPGLQPGWHNARLRIAGGRYTAPVRIGIDLPASTRRNWRTKTPSTLEITRLADGKTFESRRARVGEGSALSVWVSGLPVEATPSQISVRLDGADLPAVWLAPESSTRQINALLPAGLEPGNATLSVVFNGAETQPIRIELYR